MARCAAEREVLAQKLAPLGKIDRLLERIEQFRTQWSGIAAGAALGLSALAIALPQIPLVRAGIAGFDLVTSLRKLFQRRS